MKFRGLPMLWHAIYLIRGGWKETPLPFGGQVQERLQAEREYDRKRDRNGGIGRVSR